MSKFYSVSDIAAAWGCSKQLVDYYRKNKLIIPDGETSAGHVWISIPEKPKPRKPGKKSTSA